MLTNCSAGDAFNMLRAPGMSAPGAPAAQDGPPQQINLTGGNPISQSVNSSTMTIVNTTLPGHAFYPGSVTIHVSPVGSSGSMVTITGTDTSSDPILNDLVGYSFFGVDVLGSVALGCAGPPMPPG